MGPVSPGSSPTGPVRDAAGVRLCSLAGISAAREKVVQLASIRRALDLSIRELDSQRSKDEFVAKSLLVVKLTKASCDAFLALAAEFSKAVLPKPTAEAARRIKGSYTAASAIAEAGTKAATGGEVSAGKTLGDIARGASDAVLKDKNARFLAKTTVIRAGIVHAALNSDAKALRKSVTDYTVELARFSLDALDQKKANAFTGIAKETFGYKQQVDAAFDEVLAMQFESRERHLNLRSTLQRQGRALDGKIRELEAFVESCEAAVPVAPA